MFSKKGYEKIHQNKRYSPGPRTGDYLTEREIMPKYEVCEHRYNAAACLICENVRLREELEKCRRFKTRVERLARKNSQLKMELALIRRKK